MTTRFFTHRTLPLLSAMLLCVGLAGQAAAQTAGDGSIYSRFGVGELRRFNSAQSQAMGGGGVSLFSLSYLNLANPASWADQVLTRVSAGVLFQGVEATDATDNVSQLSEGTLNAFHFSFPILRQKLGFAVAYEPYSRVSYRVQSEGLLDPGPIFSDTTQYTIGVQGSGGLQHVVGGIGYRISRYLNVGINADFIFGILENARETQFSGSATGGFQEAVLANNTRLKGFSATVGALASLPQPFAESDVLSVGAAVTLPTVLDGTYVRTLGTGLDRDTLGQAVDGSLTLPLRARLGAAYLYDNRWTFVADALYEPWGSYDGGEVLPDLESDRIDVAYNDRFRASLGAEFLPAGSNILEPFLRRVAYRLGFYYDQSYVSPVADVNLRTVAVTGGLGLPALFPGTRLDIGVEVGTRGTTDNGLVRDLFYRVSASVNFGERWFEERKLR